MCNAYLEGDGFFGLSQNKAPHRASGDIRSLTPAGMHQGIITESKIFILQVDPSELSLSRYLLPILTNDHGVCFLISRLFRSGHVELTVGWYITLGISPNYKWLNFELYQLAIAGSRRWDASVNMKEPLHGYVTLIPLFFFFSRLEITPFNNIIFYASVLSQEISEIIFFTFNFDCIII